MDVDRWMLIDEMNGLATVVDLVFRMTNQGKGGCNEKEYVGDISCDAQNTIL